MNPARPRHCESRIKGKPGYLKLLKDYKCVLPKGKKAGFLLPMLTRLILIRHGITKWNIEKRYCGHKDIGLNSQGKRQARALRRKLKSVQFDAIYTSDRRRAIQTAGIIFKGAKITRVKDLREMDFGALEGLTHREALKRWPVIYKRWLDNPFKNSIPGAEQFNSFQDRVKRAVKRIIRLNHGKTVAIVCHGGTIRALSE